MFLLFLVFDFSLLITLLLLYQIIKWWRKGTLCDTHFEAKRSGLWRGWYFLIRPLIC
jgi:hypothetical protein